MTTTFHLGVLDVPYAQAMAAPERRVARWRYAKKPWQHFGSLNTTGDVAEILERRYGIMGIFYEVHGTEIVSAVESAMQGKLENLLMGSPADTSGPLFAAGDLSQVEEMFRHFLDAEEMNGRAPGVPTKAALDGVNHRLKHPYVASNPPRPSFIDTGLYQASMRAWVEE